VHEISLMTGLLEAVEEAARDAGAERVVAISLTIGDMTEVVPESLTFAFDALTPDTMCEGAELKVTYVHPKSRCLDCGIEFEHDRYHLICPSCGSLTTTLIAGREMLIDNIEVDLPD
jgi:hydrogenase nickel incorporation protein HypA/HybF